ncbi:MAG: CatB-related O-acetyltransferase [Deltaproteobacteria bacterium]|nr:CatB-related O-acetyltransferase [Deltaproteobacteria bacterium]
MENQYSNQKRRTIIEIGRNVFLPNDAKITVPRCVIGDNTRINGPIVIRGQEECFIGKYSAFGYHITIITTNHDMTKANLQVNMHRHFGFSSLEITKGPVNIGNNVWIADNVTILSGVNIGDGCVIGAGAVVTHNLPSFSVSMGMPAKMTNYRFDEKIIEQLLEIKWWDWPPNKISKNKEFFETDLSKYKGRSLSDLITD